MKPNTSMACNNLFFPAGRKGSKTNCPEKNFPPILALILNPTQTLTSTGGQFSFWRIVRTPVKTKETKTYKEIKKQ